MLSRKSERPEHDRIDANPATKPPLRRRALLAALPGLSVLPGLGWIPRWAEAADAKTGDTAVSVFKFMSPTQIADVKARTNQVTVAEAINAAFAASKRVTFPEGSYYLGEFRDGAAAIDLATRGDGISIETSGNVELVIKTAGWGSPRIFRLSGNSNFSCQNVSFRDLRYDKHVDWQGAVGFYLDASSGTDWGSLTFREIRSKTMVASIQCSRHAGSKGTLAKITIDAIYSDDCYYGANFSALGDQVHIGAIHAHQNYRPFFAYGVTGHDVTVYNEDPLPTTGCVNISRGTTPASRGYDTRDIRVKYQCRSNALSASVNHVNINQFLDSDGTIDNIQLDLDIDDKRNVSVYFANYTKAGGSPTSAPASDKQVVSNITITGSANGPIAGLATYARKPAIRLKGALKPLDDFKANIAAT